MTYKLYAILGGFLALAAIALSVMFIVSGERDARASTVFLGPYLQSATTSTAVAVTTSARIMATTTNPTDPTNSYNRIYATICNPNANPVYINLNADKAASKSAATYVIAAAAGYNVCYEINDRNAYNGSVTASSTSETSTTIFVSQYVAN